MLQDTVVPVPNRYLGQKPGHWTLQPRDDLGHVAQQIVDPAGVGVTLNIGPGT